MVVVSVNSDVLLASVEFLIHRYDFLVYTINLPQLLYHNIFYKKYCYQLTYSNNDNTSLFWEFMPVMYLLFCVSG